MAVHFLREGCHCLTFAATRETRFCPANVQTGHARYAGFNRNGCENSIFLAKSGHSPGIFAAPLAREAAGG
jgi:hypothetical protein